MSAPTTFQVTGCNSFWKIHSFHFFQIKSVKVTPGSSFVQTMMGWSPWCHMPSLVKIGLPVLEKKIFEGVYHLWAWWPSWSCDPDAANKISLPLPKEAPHKIWLWLVKQFRRRSLSIVNDDDDGHRTDAGPWVSYKLTYEPLAQVS